MFRSLMAIIRELYLYLTKVLLVCELRRIQNARCKDENYCRDCFVYIKIQIVIN